MNVLYNSILFCSLILVNLQVLLFLPLYCVNEINILCIKASTMNMENYFFLESRDVDDKI